MLARTYAYFIDMRRLKTETTDRKACAVVKTEKDAGNASDVC